MFLSSLPRIFRLVLALVVLIVLLAVLAFGTLFYVLDEKSVKATIDSYAKQAFNASVEYDGEIRLKHLTSLKVQIPALRFVDLDSGSTIGSIASAQADVAMWSALLGAVNVNAILIDGARLSLRVPRANGDALFEEAFGSVRFPKDLRVSQFRLNDARIDLVTGAEQVARSWKISALTLSTGRLSPEMTTPFEVSAHFEASSETSLAASQSVWTESSEAKQIADTASSQTESSVLFHSEKQSDNNANQAAPSDFSAEQSSEPAADEADAPFEANPSASTSGNEQNSEPVLNVLAGKLQTAPLAWFDPSSLSGDLSAKGTITLSVTDRYVMIEDVNFAGEISHKDTAWTAVARADRIRFKGDEVSGSNLTASLSRPEDTTGDIHFGAVDFRLRPGMLESPEMRISRTEERGSRVSSVEVAGSVRADFVNATADLDNLTARIGITGDAALPSDFNASVSGFLKADFRQNQAQVGLSGDFAGAPISFNGSIRNTKPTMELEGELMLGEISQDTLPGTEVLAWMRLFDFSGAVRISRISAAGLSGTQLSGTLDIKNGRAVIDSLVVNTSEGRLFGTFAFNEDTSWVFDGRVDGVSLDKFIASVAGSSPVAGIANGDVSLSGNGFSLDSLNGKSKLRVLRPSYVGLDASAVRNHLVSNADTALITRQGAHTDLDEAGLTIRLTGARMELQDVMARSVFLRAHANATLELTAGTLEGACSLTFAPQQGIPSIHLSAELAGNGKTPSWTFDWQKSAEALRRAQGKPVLPTKKEEKSIWQSVKDFFSF